MSDDIKQKIMIFAAVFLTMMMVMQFMARKEQARIAREKWRKQQAKGQGDPGGTNAQSQAAAKPETAPATAQNKKEKTTPAPAVKPAASEPAAAAAEPARVLEIGITRGKAGKRFRMLFTTRGAALKRLVLLDYFHTSAKKPGQEIILLDEVGADLDKAAPCPASLSIMTLDEKAIAGRNYSLVSVPGDAELPAGADAVKRNDKNELVMRTVVDAWEITRTYTFLPKPDFVFAFKVSLRNLATKARKVSYRIVGPCGIVPDDAGRWSPLEISSTQLSSSKPVKTDVTREIVPRISKSKFLVMPRSREEIEVETETLLKHESRDERANLCWLGLKNRFFAAIMLVDDPSITLSSTRRYIRISSNYKQAHPGISQILQVHTFSGKVDLKTAKPGHMVQPGEILEHGYRFYGGPADEKELAFDPRLDNLISYTWGIFNPISQYLVKLLNLIGSAVGNYGIAMILLTLLIKTLLHPLTRKGLRSSHKMQKVAPLIKEVQRKYKDQREKAQQEIMRIYREQGVSPMGGCLPMLIQLPIFFSLYGAFSRGFAVRQASFVPGWIDDLAVPDSIFHWQTPLPVVEWTDLSLLPIAYLIMQIIQMSMQPKSDDPQVQQQQKMMKIMPIVFVFIFYTMPSGLVLYFTVSSLYTLIEHWLIKRKLEDEADRPGGAPAAAGVGIRTPAAPNAGAGAGIGMGLPGGKKKKKRKK